MNGACRRLAARWYLAVSSCILPPDLLEEELWRRMKLNEGAGERLLRGGNPSALGCLL